MNEYNIGTFPTPSVYLVEWMEKWGEGDKK